MSLQTPKVHFPVPERIPGEEVYDRQKVDMLRAHMARICQLRDSRFPGSQPVSFSRQSFALLESEDFWVCEKSDGLRLMIMILSRPTGHQEVYLIDRKERFFEVQNLRFPHQDGEEYNHSNTIIDGELVIDIERHNSGLEVLRYLAFDCIVLDSESLMQRPLSSRYGRLKSWIIEPMVRYLRKHPHEQARMPFEVTLKPMELSYGIQKVLETHMPGLKHGNDGLIFTSAEAQYTIGTDRRILKWKPPSENSIDFRLELRFPALVHTRVEGSSRNGYGVEDVDWQAKPAFLLMMNAGKGSETFFDWLDMSDHEWEDWKSRGEQLDNRIVEVVWNASEQNWRIMRFRDDKREGNYESIVWKIIDSIKDGVEAQDVGHVFLLSICG
ncbi:hypothetical protein BT69DRAFT_1230124 [Atractiella rhizophila]|nr:hypothetical protein BT69DRAFT_1230124 [Atractiella rhizophila]